MPPRHGSSGGGGGGPGSPGKKTLSDSEVLAYNKNRFADRKFRYTVRQLHTQEQVTHDKHQRDIYRWKDFMKNSTRTTGAWFTSPYPEEEEEELEESPRNGPLRSARGTRPNSPSKHNINGSMEMARSLVIQNDALVRLQKPWAYTYTETSYNTIYKEAEEIAKGQEKRLFFRRATSASFAVPSSSSSASSSSSPEQKGRTEKQKMLFRSRSSMGEELLNPGSKVELEKRPWTAKVPTNHTSVFPLTPRAKSSNGVHPSKHSANRTSSPSKDTFSSSSTSNINVKLKERPKTSSKPKISAFLSSNNGLNTSRPNTSLGTARNRPKLQKTPRVNSDEHLRLSNDQNGTEINGFCNDRLQQTSTKGNDFRMSGANKLSADINNTGNCDLEVDSISEYRPQAVAVHVNVHIFADGVVPKDRENGKAKETKLPEIKPNELAKSSSKETKLNTIQSQNTDSDNPAAEMIVLTTLNLVTETEVSKTNGVSPGETPNSSRRRKQGMVVFSPSGISNNVEDHTHNTVDKTTIINNSSNNNNNRNTNSSNDSNGNLPTSVSVTSSNHNNADPTGYREAIPEEESSSNISEHCIESANKPHHTDKSPAISSPPQHREGPKRDQNSEASINTDRAKSSNKNNQQTSITSSRRRSIASTSRGPLEADQDPRSTTVAASSQDKSAAPVISDAALKNGENIFTENENGGGGGDGGGASSGDNQLIPVEQAGDITANRKITRRGSDFTSKSARLVRQRSERSPISSNNDLAQRGALTRRCSAIEMRRRGSILKFVDNLEALHEYTLGRLANVDDDDEGDGEGTSSSNGQSPNKGVSGAPTITISENGKDCALNGTGPNQTAKSGLSGLEDVSATKPLNNRRQSYFQIPDGNHGIGLLQSQNSYLKSNAQENPSFPNRTDNNKPLAAVNPTPTNSRTSEDTAATLGKATTTTTTPIQASDQAVPHKEDNVNVQRDYEVRKDFFQVSGGHELYDDDDQFYGGDYVIFKGFKIWNYVRPQERYREERFTSSGRREKTLLRLSVDNPECLQQGSRGDLFKRPPLVFPKSARQKVLNELVQRNHKPQKTDEAGVVPRELRARIDEFFESIKPYCPKQGLMLDD